MMRGWEGCQKSRRIDVTKQILINILIQEAADADAQYLMLRTLWWQPFFFKENLTLIPSFLSALILIMGFGGRRFQRA